MTEGGPIERVLEAYRAAVQAKDVDAFVALYDEDVCVFDLWGRWSYDGADVWRGMVEEWFGSLGNDRAAVEFEDVQTIVGDGVAAAHAFVTFKGLSAEGEELRVMHNRMTWALRKTDGGDWKVVHEHTSAPVDFETAKVVLQR
jgi:uncharacterized protein (TIGR02246 family)